MEGKIFFREDQLDELQSLVDIIIPNDALVKIDEYEFKKLTYLPNKPNVLYVNMDTEDWAKMKRKYFKDRKPCNLPGVIHID
jgi:hypothetical protein